MPITSLEIDVQLAEAGSPAASFARLWKSLWRQPYLSPAVLESCRLMLARLHRDEAEMAADNPFVPAGALPQAKRALLFEGKALASGHFTTARTVLAFCESYALDASSITDQQAAAVSAEIGEAGLVFLIEALGCLDGRIRAARCLRDLAAFGGREKAEHAR